MTIGDWTIQVNHPAERGKPLTPRSICSHLMALRAFFSDCHEWEWFPRRFDPNRSLQLPVSVKCLIGPDPRIVADDVWAKLVWAGLNLEESRPAADGLPASLLSVGSGSRHDDHLVVCRSAM